MLTNVLDSFVNSFSLRQSTIFGYANNLLALFVVIELTLFGIYFALEGGDLVQSLFKKIMVIGAFQFLLLKYAWIVDGLRDSFVGIGLANGSGPSLSLTEFLDPSALISHGFDVVAPVMEQQVGFVGMLTGLGLTIIAKYISVILILVMFAVMGLQVFLTLVEFYIVTTLGIILIPFGLFKPTSFLADKAIGAVFTTCIKLMVLAFTASVALPIINTFKFTSDNPTFRESFMLLIGVCAVALVIQKAPSIALGMVSGSSNLDLGPMLKPMKHAAGGAGSAAQTIGSSINNAPSIAEGFRNGLAGSAAKAASNMASGGGNTLVGMAAGLAESGAQATASATGKMTGQALRASGVMESGEKKNS